MALKNGVRYFAVSGITRTVSDPHFVFREIVTKDEYDLQYWNRERRRWETDMSLSAYTVNGEAGSKQITRRECEKIIGRLIAENPQPSSTK